MSNQTSFLSLECMTKIKRADRFLDEMNRVVPWAELVAIIAPHWGQAAGTGRKLTDVELLLKSGTIVDATILAAPSSTKNASGQRDPEMSSTRKGQAWHFGLKAHIGVDEQSGLVHSVQTTTASTHDATMLEALLHGEEQALVADSAYGNMTLKAYCREAGLHYLITDKAARSVKLSGKQHRTNRKKSSVPWQGRVPLPDHQTALGSHQSALPRSPEERFPAPRPVRPQQSLPSAQATPRPGLTGALRTRSCTQSHLIFPPSRPPAVGAAARPA